MGLNGMVSGYTISTVFFFHRLMGDQRTLKFWGITLMVVKSRLNSYLSKNLNLTLFKLPLEDS